MTIYLELIRPDGTEELILVNENGAAIPVHSGDEIVLKDEHGRPVKGQLKPDGNNLIIVFEDDREVCLENFYDDDEEGEPILVSLQAPQVMEESASEIESGTGNLRGVGDFTLMRYSSTKYIGFEDPITTDRETFTGGSGGGGGGDQPDEPNLTNNAVIAEDDEFTSREGKAIKLRVLPNDSDPQNDSFSIALINGRPVGVGQSVKLPSGAVITLRGDGSIDYNPGKSFEYLDEGETAVDRFTYTIVDEKGSSDTGTARIIITGDDQASDPNPDFAITPEGSEVTISVLENDDDPDTSDTLTITSVTQPPMGSVSISGDDLIFDPQGEFDDLDIGESATVTFTYTVETPDGDQSTETVTVTITGEDDPTITAPDTGSVDEDSTVTVSVLINDSDPDLNDNPLSVTNLTQPPGGQGSATTDGTEVTFDPGTDFQDLGEGETEIVTFTYDATTPDGKTTTETVTITVIGTNDGPEAVGTITNQDNDDSDVVVSVDVSSNFSDPDTTDVLIFTDGGSLPPGLTIDSNTGVISGTIEEDASTGGPYTVSITAEDPEGATVIQTFTWNVDNPEPIAVDDSWSAGEDSGSTVVGNALTDGTTGDSDPDGDSISATPQTNTPGDNGGVFSITSTGEVAFDPGTDFQDLDTGETDVTSFVYTITDADGATASATVTVTVTGDTDGPPTVTVDDEDGVVTTADNSVEEDTGNTVTGDVTVGAEAGISTVTVEGQDITNASTTQVVIATGDYGTLTVTGYNPATGAITYSYEEEGSPENHNSTDDNIIDQFSVVVTDFAGESTSDTIDIMITDTDPTANDDSASITEDTASITDSVVFTSGADSGDVDPQTDTVGTYGDFSIDASGNYTYELDNSLVAIQALDTGESLTDTFTYTVTDNDGDTDTATVTITINGQTDAPPTVTIDDEDAAATSADNSVAEDSSATVTGDISVSAEAGVSGVTIAGQDITNASTTPVVITTGDYGTLTVTGYNPTTGAITYSYEEEGSPENHNPTNDNIVDQFEVVVTDGAGETNSDTLDIMVTDTVPTASDDSASITEDTASITDSVTFTSGADSGDVDVQTDTAGTYGDFSIDAGGNYTYELDNSLVAIQALDTGDSLTDTFTYTVTDNDGDTDTATVTITINGQTDAPPTVTIDDEDAAATSADNSVAENSGATVTGDITVSAEAGVSGVTIAGQDITNASTTPVVITTGDYGTLTVTGYNPTTGAITYSYEEEGSPETHNPTNDNIVDQFEVVVTDGAGETNSDTLDIMVTDTVPTASDDSASITEETASITDSVTFTSGADSGDVDVQTDTAGTYGDFSIDASGNYTYELDNSLVAIQALDTGESLTDTFTYTVTDNDGDTDTATVTITINGQTDAPPVVTVEDEDGGVTTADNSVAEDSGATVTGDISVSAEAGVSGVTIAGQDITNASTTPVVITTGDYGTLTVTGYNPTTGAITYSYEEEGSPETHNPTNDNIVDQFEVVVTDGAGETNSDTLDIMVTDTVPTASDDSASITEDTASITDSVTFTAGADSGDVDAQTDTAGSYGDFSIDANGDYVYELDNSLVAIQALDTGDSLTDTFTYTVTDNDGDTDTATVTITINGQTDGPPTVTIDDEDAAVTSADNSVEEATGNTVTGDITVSAGAGVSAVTIAGQDITNASTTPVVITTGDYGTLTVTGYNASTGAITYSYEEENSAENHNAANDNIVDQYTVLVTDGAGATVSDTLDIMVTDTVPTASDDSASITEDTASIIDSVVFTSGADSGDVDVQTDTAGTYGDFSIDASGNYTYELDNSLVAIQALDTGDSLTDAFTYTVTDDDGDTDTATVTITINGQTDGPPTITIDDEDAAVTSADNSVEEATGNTVTGDITVSAGAGVSAVTIAGQDITNASTTPVVITTGDYGTLTVTGYDASTGAITYSYQEENSAENHNATNDNIVDQYTVLVTDGAGATVSDTLDIMVTDTVPTASDDSASITEDTASITDSVVFTGGADSGDVDVQTDTAGTYGDFSIAADGSYTYELNNGLVAIQALDTGESLTDTFTYTVTDDDGDTDTATVTITINGQTDAPPTVIIDDEDAAVTSADNSVEEATGNTVTGDITVSAGAGVSAVTIAGQDITNASTTPVVITTGDYGTLTVTGYNASTGAITYSYEEENSAENHNTANDNIVDQYTVLVTDGAGATTSDTLDIMVTDTVPTADDDSASITEDTASITDSVVFTSGADSGDVDAQTDTAGSYGDFSIDASGNYTYELDNSLVAIQALDTGDSLTDTFTYTVTDDDGDTDTATVTITINGQTDGPPTITIDDEDAAVTSADNSVEEATGNTVTGDITVSAGAGVSAVTIAGQDITNASTTPVVITTGDYGTLTVTGYNASTGAITYSYEEENSAENHNATNDNIVDQYTVLVTDGAGATVSDTLDIMVTDTVPTVSDDFASITEDTASITDSVTFTSGADSGDVDAQTDTAGTYGDFSIDANGDYVYELDNSLVAIQALDTGDSLTDTFTYTVTDDDGDTDTATVTITINGQTDGPPTVTIDDEDGAVTAADNSVEEATGNTVTGDITVSAGAGVSAVTIAGQDITNASTTPVVITTGDYGTLTVTGYNASTGAITYSYQEENSAENHNATNDNIVDQYTVLVTDGAGATVSDTLDIMVTDTVPTASDDSASITEDTASITDSVVFTSGADSGDVDAQADTAGTYGGFSIDANGDYVYELDNSLVAIQALDTGDSLTDTFTYTVTDDDGDTNTATVTITINGQTDGPPTITIDDEDAAVTSADNSVEEATGDTVTGDITVSAGAGVSALTIAGQDITNASTTPVVITTGDYGTLTVTGYNASTGAITYSYEEENSAENHNATNDNIVDQYTVLVTDGAGATVSDTLYIMITDTVPTASDDSASITEDTSSITDSVVFTSGADSGDVDPQTDTVGTYGDFSIDASGNYTYELDNSLVAIQALDTGESLTDTFTYTVTDNDGDTDTATVTITINGQTDGPPTVTIDDEDAAVTAADNSVEEATGNTVTGDITVSAGAGVSAVTIAGQDITNASTTPVVITTGDYGTLTVTGYNPTTGAITYSYEEEGSPETHNATNDNIVDQFEVVVTDGAGETNSDTLDIMVTDTVPTASDDSASITEDTASITDSVVFASGADSGDVDVQVDTAGTYGDFSIDASGNYTYELDNSLVAIQALDTGESLTDTFTYTVTDNDGDTDTATVTITINGQTDGPPTVTIDDEDAAVTAADNSVEEATGNTVTGDITVSAGAGVSTVTIAGQDITNASTTPVVITTGDYGTLTVTGYNASTGAITYSYQEENSAENHNAANDNIVDQYTVLVTDGAGATVSDTLDIMVTDTVPTASDDSASITEDTASVTDSVVFTAGADNGDVDAQTATAGSYGDFSIDAIGNYTYELDNTSAAVQGLDDGETLLDTFNYTVTDADGDTDTATVTITVTGANDGPVAVNDAGSVNGGGVLTVTQALGVIDNATTGDSDIDGDTLTVSAIRTGSESGSGTAGTVGADLTGSLGTLTLNSDGSYTYAADQSGADALANGETATDIFTYTITDGDLTDTAELVITVTGTNDAPTVTDATDVSGSVTEIADGGAGENINNLTDGGSFDIGDVDGDTQTVSVTSDTTGFLGTFTPSISDNTTGDGTGQIDWNFSVNDADVDYLAAGQTVTQTYTITVNDQEGGTVTQDVTVTINGTNDAPDITIETGDSAAASLTETDVALATGDTLTLNDVDVTDTVDVAVSSVSTGGVTSGLGSNNAALLSMLTLNPTDDVLDNSETSDQFTWSFDSDSEAFDYLAAGETLTLTYTVTATDSESATDTQEITLTITGTNDGPTVASGSEIPDQNGVDAQSSISIATAGAFDDLDNSDTLTYSVSGLPTGLSIDSSTGEITGTIDSSASQGGPGSDGIYTVVVTANDGTATVTDTFTYTVTNPPPVAINDTWSIGEDDTATVVGNAMTDGTTGDSDPDGDTITATAQTNTAGDNGGLFSITPTGDVTFDPGTDFQSLDAGESATTSFTYTITDADGATDTATVTVTVNGADDPSVITVGAGDSDTGAVTEDVDTDAGTAGIQLEQSGTLTVTDVDTSDTAAFNPAATSLSSTTHTSQLGTLTIDDSGDWDYSVDNADVQFLDAGETIVETYTVEATDGTSHDITITINGAEDAPVLGGDITGEVTEDTDLTDSGTVTITDVDTSDNPVSFPDQGSTAGDNDYGDFELSDGDWTYTLDNSDTDVQALDTGETLTDTITYTATDGSTQTVTVTINGVTDSAPVITIDDEDGSATAGDNSVEEATGSTVSGDISVSADAGVAGVTIAGQDITNASTTPVVIVGTYGTLTVTGYDSVTGAITYDYAEENSAELHNATDDNHVDQFTVLVTDGAGESSSDTLDITITDTVPVANDDSASIDEDTASVTDSVVVTSGADADSITAQTNTAGTYGDFSIDASGNYTYNLDTASVQSLNPGATVIDTFSYATTDADGDTSTANVTITINGLNDPPTAVDDHEVATEDTPLVIASLTNDSDPDGDPLNICGIEVGGVMVSPTVGVPITIDSGATVTLQADGTFLYETAQPTVSETPLSGEVVFIAGDVTNAAELIAELSSYDNVFVLDADGDSMEQMATILDGATDLDAIHILTHGAPGELQMGGSTVLNDTTANGIYADELSAIGSALSATGDILIYGCDVAGTPAGEAFVDTLATLTGADVAASTDDTGHTTLGGDWVLEDVAGAVEASTIDASGWVGELTPSLDLDDDDNSGATGSDFQTVYAEDTPSTPLVDVGDVLALEPDGDNIAQIDITLNGPVVDGSSEVIYAITASAVRSFPLDGDSISSAGNVGGTFFRYDFDSPSSTLTITHWNLPTMTLAQVTDVLEALNYTNSSHNPTTGDRVFDVTITDENGETATAQSTINVVANNDAAVISLDSDNSVGEPALIRLYDHGEVTGTAGALDGTLPNGDTFTITGGQVDMYINDDSVENPQFRDTYSTQLDWLAFPPSTHHTTLLEFSGGPAPEGTLLVMRDVDAGEGVRITAADGSTPVHLENIELLSGESSGFPTYDALTGQLSSGGTNYRDGLVVLDVTGMEDITIQRTSGQYFQFAVVGAEVQYTDYRTTFTEDGPAVAISDVDTLVRDVDDSNMESATITLTNPQADDRLLIDGTPVVASGAGVTLSGVAYIVSADGYTITLTGTHSMADYAAAIESISFENTSDDPDTTDRIIHVTVNDGEADSNTAVATIEIVPVDDANAFDYLDEGETAIDSFVYKIDDGVSGTDTATVFVTINGQDDPTVTNPDAGTVDEDSTVSVSVLTNDSDPDTSDNPLTVTNLTQPTPGQGSVSTDGTNVIFDPGTDFQDLDDGETEIVTFTYDATTPDGDTVTETVTITVNGLNDGPIAVNDSGSVNEDATLTTTAAIGVIDPNDSDVDGDTLTVSAIRTGSESGAGTSGAVGGDLTGTLGTLTLNDDGSYTYAADQSGADALANGETATDIFTYTVTDGDLTDTAELVITVTGTNDAPTVTDATDVSGSVTEIADGGAGENINNLTDSGSFDIGDVDGDTQTVSVTSDTTGFLGTFTPSISDNTTGDGTGQIDWNFSVNDADVDYLAAGQTVTQTYTITVNDQQGGTVTQDVTVTINGTNDAPDITIETGDSAAASLTETDAALATGDTLTLNDVDVTDTVDVAVSSVSTGGVTSGLGSNNAALLSMLTLNPTDDVLDNSETSDQFTWSFDSDSEAFDYLAAGETLTLTYTVTATDSQSATDTQDITLTITGSNDAPTVVSGSEIPDQNGADAQSSISIATAGAFDDIDTSDTLTYSASGLPTGLSIDPNTGEITGTIDNSASQGGPGSDGIYTVTVTADDGTATVTDTFTYTVTNPAPTAVDNANFGY